MYNNLELVIGPLFSGVLLIDRELVSFFSTTLTQCILKAGCLSAMKVWRKYKVCEYGEVQEYLTEVKACIKMYLEKKYGKFPIRSFWYYKNKKKYFTPISSYCYNTVIWLAKDYLHRCEVSHKWVPASLFTRALQQMLKIKVSLADLVT